MKRIMMVLMLLGVLALGGYQIVFAEPPLENCTVTGCWSHFCEKACHCVSLNMDMACRMCPETSNCPW